MHEQIFLIIREYYKQLYINRVEKYMANFTGKYKISK